MLKTLCLFFAGILVSFQLYSQSWTRMQSWGLDLESITWVNSDFGISVGENLIIRTTDGGVSWEEITINYEGKLLDVAFWDEKTGVAVGEKGLILLTEDSGENWAKISIASSSSLNNVAVSENIAFAIGEAGTILTSSNKGKNWIQLNSGTSADLFDIAPITRDSIYISGGQGKILHSIDSGKSWNQLATGQNKDLFGIAFSTPLTGYAVGSGGVIIKTIDAGSTWTTQSSGVATDLKKIAISPIDNRIITVVGNSATALRSPNAGNTFAKANLGISNNRNLTSLAFKPASNQVYATGLNGYMIYSSNAGNNYSTLLNGNRINYTGVDFKSEKTGSFIGNDGNVLFTNNGAAALVSRPVPENIDLAGFDYWNTSYGYVGAESGKIYRTGNSGSSWANVSAPTDNRITGFYLFAPSVLYITGANGYIASSFNSGASWEVKTSTNTKEDLRDITFFDYQIGFAIGKKGEVLWSNGGTIWENMPNLTNEDLNSLAKLDSSTTIIVGNNGIILKATDKARNWKVIPSPAQTNLNGVDFWDENLGFIAGDNGLILQTKDGGETWIEIPTGTTRNLKGVSIGTSLVAYAVGDDGTILKYICAPPSKLGQITGPATSCLIKATYAIDDALVPGAQLVWRVDGGEISSGQGTNQIEVDWKIPGRNGVFVSRQNFCGNGATSFTEVLVSQIPLQNLPIEGEGTVCKGNSYEYTIDSDSSATHTWEAAGGEIIDGQGSTSVQVRWTSEGTNQLTVTQENSCGKAEPIKKIITVNSVPSQPGEIQGETQLGLSEAEYTIPVEEGIHYVWKVAEEGGKILTGQGSGSVKVSWEKEGDFEISVTPENECNEGESRSISVNVNVITGIPEIQDPSLRIYPNPSSGTLYIELGAVQWRQIRIINSLGQEIKSLQPTEGLKEIEFNNLPKGLLLIQLESTSGIQTHKVVVN